MRTLDDYLAVATPVGERNTALFHAVLLARRHGWSEYDIEQIIGGKARADGLSASEIRSTIRSAMRYDITPQRHVDHGAIAWDAVIGRDYDQPAATASELPPPSETWEQTDLPRFVELLFQPDEFVAYNVSYKRDGDRIRPDGRGVYHRRARDIIAACHEPDTVAAQAIGAQQEAGAWIRLNPVDGRGVCDANVTAYRHALVECDQLPIDEQWRRITALRVPCTTVVHSGGKSLHFAVRIDARNAAEYSARVARLYDILERAGIPLDRQNRNASRLSRLPGVWRGTQRQYLVATNIGCDDYDAWIRHIETARTRLPIRTLGDMLATVPPPAPELIRGILRHGHKMLFAGGSKSGKTFAMIALARAISCGGEWFGYQCHQARVLYINLEVDEASFVQRVRDVQDAVGAANADAFHVLNLRGHSEPLNKLSTRLLRQIEPGYYGAVIVDPIYKVYMGDENSARDIAELCRHIDRLAEDLQSSVIIVSHFAKGAQGGRASIDRASGSGVFGRDPDAVGTLTATEEERVFMLEWTLREFRAPDPVPVVWEWPCHRIDYSYSGVQLAGQKGRRTSITRVMLEAAIRDVGNGERFARIVDVAKHLNVSDKTIRRHAIEYGMRTTGGLVEYE